MPTAREVAAVAADHAGSVSVAMVAEVEVAGEEGDSGPYSVQASQSRSLRR